MRKFKLSINLILFTILFSIALIPSLFTIVPQIKVTKEINKAKKQCLSLANIIKGTFDGIYILEEGFDTNLNNLLDMLFANNIKIPGQKQYNIYIVDNNGFVLYQNLQIKTKLPNIENKFMDLEFYKQFPDYYFGSEYYENKSTILGSEVKKALKGKTSYKLRYELLLPFSMEKVNTTLYTAIPLKGVAAILIVYNFEDPMFHESTKFNYYPTIFSTIFAIVLGFVFFFTVNKKLISISQSTSHFAKQQGRISNTVIPVKEDRTEISLLKQEFEELVNKINNNMDFLETFSSDVSHELKNPITSITLTTEYLLEDATNLSTASLEPLKQEIKHIEELLKEMSENQILNNKAPTITYFDYSNAIKQTIRRVKNKYPNLNIKYNEEDGDKEYILISEEHFLRIFENLIDNAASFANDVIVTKHVQNNEIISFDIEDSGKGIEESEYDKIFNRFYSNRENIAIKSFHSGLGLSTVKTLIELYNGTITVNQSEKLKGAKFTVSLHYKRGIV